MPDSAAVDLKWRELAQKTPECCDRQHAKPQALVAGQPGAKFTIKIGFLEGRKNLPIVTLKRAA